MSNELDDLLRTMPREEAPLGFASDVLTRLDQPRPRPVWRLAAAATVAVALVIGGTAWLSHSASQRALRAEMAALHEQHQQLQSQLAELRVRLARPKVVVGGNDHVDYVLDLDRLSEVEDARDGDELIWVPRQSTGDTL